MKRLNPVNGKLFKQGDTRKDGRVFMKYNIKKIDESGKFKEVWYTKESYQKYKLNNKENKIKNRKKYDEKSKRVFKNLLDKGLIKKRINPITRRLYKQGDKKDDGKIFCEYHKNYVPSDGFYPETWLNEDSFLKYKINKTLIRFKRKCKIKNLRFNIDKNFLYEIFPKNYICPILKKKMYWGEGEHNLRSFSPSLDRIKPEKGYIKGNVRWISNICNIHKSDRDLKIIEMVYFDMKKIFENKSKYFSLIRKFKTYDTKDNYKK